jgi:cyclase
MGRVVKGVRFRDHVDMGDIVELALRYRDEGADELVFYDITASPEGRARRCAWVERVARLIDIPFCVAGGIRSVEDRARGAGGGRRQGVGQHAGAGAAGADLRTGRCLRQQCVVVGIDSPARRRRRMAGAQPHRRSGSKTRPGASRTLDWVREAQQLGAGEIVLNCMGSDGVREGYDLEQLQAVRALRGAAGRLRRRRRRRISSTCSGRPTSTPRWPPAPSIPARCCGFRN